MSAIVISLMVFFCIHFQILAITCIEDSLLAAKARWINEYQVQTCAQKKAMEMNLEGALIFLEPYARSEQQINAWRLQSEKLLASWSAVYSAHLVMNCEELIHGQVEIYRQVHDELPFEYPNWWLRWIKVDGGDM